MNISGRLFWFVVCLVGFCFVFLFIFLLGRARKLVQEIHYFEDFRSMLTSLGVKRALPAARSVAEGVRVYHKFHGYERLAQQHGVVAFMIGPVPEALAAAAAEATMTWTPEQARVNAL